VYGKTRWNIARKMFGYLKKAIAEFGYRSVAIPFTHALRNFDMMLDLLFQIRYR